MPAECDEWGVAVPSEHEKVSAVADRRYNLRLTQPPLQRITHAS